jgi:ankyrin repeat protein
VSHGPAPYEREIRTVIAACQTAACGHVRILDLLVKRNIVSLDDGDYDQRTPLHVAVAASQLEAVRYLIKQGVQINPKDRWGSTPLNDANNKEIADLLQANGAKAGKRNAYTPIKIQNLNDDDNRLFYAAFKNDIKSLTILKNLGLRVNAYDYDGRTALGIAASEGHT